MGALRARLAESLRAFREVFANANLRRLELAWAGSITGRWAFGVALVVYAYRAGGASAVGLVGLIQFLPSAIAAPLTALLGDRYRRERVMLASDLVRAVALAAAAAAAFAGAPAAVVYALAALVTVTSTAFHPAQAALLPSLARTPDELTASNVTSSTIESIGSFAGPALGGVLVAATSAGVVFALTAATFLWSGLMIARISRGEDEPEEAEPRPGIVEETLAGFRAIAADARLRLLVGLFGAQTLVAGALSVLTVAASFELLGLGKSGVGFLNSAIGVGGLLGALAALGLVGRRRLAASFGAGIVLWGAPLVLVGIWPNPAAALVLLGILGVGNTLVDVAGLTLLQRSVPDAVLARVFGVLESLFSATIGIGAIAAPALIHAFGIRATLVVAGAFLPVLMALSWRRLTAIDAAAAVPERELALLRAIPIFSPLPAATLEHLASSLERVRFGPRTPIVRQGDPGDRFYVVGDGELDVSADGRELAGLRPGDSFGEIALLRQVARTASVTSRGAVELFALERDEFIAAVTGHPPSAEAADAVIGARLGALRTGVAAV